MAWLEVWRKTEAASYITVLSLEEQHEIIGAFLWRPLVARRFIAAIEEGRTIRAAWAKATEPVP